jgi:predicted Zn-dependent protease
LPTVIGWLKPVVLLPTSALAGLAPNQMEAILAHELAHVRRHGLHRQSPSRPSSRRCCSITRRSGGCRTGFAPSARTAATILP